MERGQSLPHLHILCQYIDDFELKVLEKRQVPEGLSDFLPSFFLSFIHF